MILITKPSLQLQPCGDPYWPSLQASAVLIPAAQMIRLKEEKWLDGSHSVGGGTRALCTVRPHPPTILVCSSEGNEMAAGWGPQRALQDCPSLGSAVSAAGPREAMAIP